jgi:hypothetical protein
MISVGFLRVLTPEEMGEQECGICRMPFRAGSVRAAIWRLDEGGDACPTCVSYLHGRNPAHFPSLRALLEATERYPEPIFSSLEEMRVFKASAGLNAVMRRTDEIWID